MLAVRFFRPIKLSPASLSTSRSHSRLFYSRVPCYGNLAYFKPCSNGLRPREHFSASNFSWKFLNAKKYYAQNFRNLGRVFTVGSIFGLCAVLGSIGPWPRVAYAMDDKYWPNALAAPESDERALFNLVRKLLVPAFLFFTVVVNWGHPLIVAIKVALILLFTRPAPSSVYIFIEQLRHELKRQRPFLYTFQSLLSKTVEVEDYMFLCLAKVEIKDETFTLIGILGSWWILPLASWNEIVFFDKPSWDELVFAIRNRFRLAADLSCY